MPSLTTYLRQRLGLKAPRPKAVPLLETLEDRVVPTAVPQTWRFEASPSLQVALISDAVPQAAQVAAAAQAGVQVVIYDSAQTDTRALTDMLASLSAAHGGAAIGRLAVIAHGSQGQVAIGGGDVWGAAGWSDDASWNQLRGLLTPDARLDLYACSAAEGDAGRAFIDHLADLTGADVFASDNPIGSGTAGDFVWEYSTTGRIQGDELFAVEQLEQVTGLLLEDPYEPNDTQAEVDGRPVGGVNSPNFGSITSTIDIPGLALQDTADWYRIVTTGLATSHDFARIEFTNTQGDLDLEVRGWDGFLLRSSTGTFVNFEEISFSNLAPDTYYVRVFGKGGVSNPTYRLIINPPGNETDDLYETNDTKPQVDSAPAGGVNSPNLGTLTSTTTIENLKLEDQSDWFRFQTTAVGTSHDFVNVTFITEADTRDGDLDLEVLDSNGTPMTGRTDESTLFTNQEGTFTAEVSLANLPAGTYYARVYGINASVGSFPNFNGAANSSYDLVINPPGNEVDDAYENNDSKAQVDSSPSGGLNSPNLGPVTVNTQIGGLKLEDTADWFRFETLAVGTSHDYVRIVFTTEADTRDGDLDLEIRDVNGNTLAGRTDEGTLFTNQEGTFFVEVSLANLPIGTYYARVYGTNSASGPGLFPNYAGAAQSSYSLSINPPGNELDDAYEDNDSKLVVDAAPAGATNSPNLGVLTSSLNLPTLRLEDTADWFRFETTAIGTSHDFVRVTFISEADTRDGDLDLEIRDVNGNTLTGRTDEGTLFTNQEGTFFVEVSMAGLAPGVYYARVYGTNAAAGPGTFPNYAGAAQSSYTMVIDPPGNEMDDAYENNDSKAVVDARTPGAIDAPNLGVLTGDRTIIGLKLEDAADWYRFETKDTGTSTHLVRITFTTEADTRDGDLDLALLDANGNVLQANEGTLFTNQEGTFNVEVSLNTRPAGVYYVRVNGINAAAGPGLFPNYNGAANAYTMLFQVPTSDMNLSLSVTPDSFSENGGAAVATGTVTRGDAPVGDLIVNLVSSRTGEATVPLTVTIPNGQTSATFPINAVDEFIDDGNQQVNITAWTSGYASGNAIVLVNDDDIAGVTITETAGSTNVSEDGATDTYSVVLDTEPFADVTITINPGGQLGANPTVLTFTAANWNVPQMVTLSAVNDLVAEGNHTGSSTHIAGSLDTAYDGINIANVTANIADNDNAGVILTPSGGSTNVSEAGVTDSYTVVLTSQPTANVIITVSPNSQLGASPSPMTFTTANWNVAQTVTVSAVNDAVFEGNHTGAITHSAASSDAPYNGISIASVTANITDNDTAGVVVTQSGGSTNVTEGGATDTYTVVLTSQPTANVSITMTPNSQVGTTPTMLTFTAGNWNVAQTVTVNAFNDDVAEGSHSGAISHAAASSDPNYNGITVASVNPINITDNDTAGVVVTESSGSTNVTEGGATDTYTVVLTSQPVADVTITLTPGSQVGASPAPLTFTAGNWNVAQTVTVNAVNDAIAEGNHADTIGHASASADPNYNGAAVASVNVSLTDNDTASVVITPSGGSTNVTEGGATDTYTVVLTSQPLGTVTVSINPNSQVTTSAPSVTFNSGNWNVAQTITVTAVNDFIAEGNHSGTVSHTSASADPNYNGLSIATVNVNITDNETAGVSIVQSGGTTNVTEAGGTDTYTVVLTSQPTAAVTIDLNPSSQVNATPTPLTFNAGNWNVAQTVTVSAIDDFIAEGNHNGTVSHTSSSADPGYNGLSITNVSASITDNDTAGVVVTPSDGSTLVAEGGTSDSYTVVLTSQPLANVTINVASGSQVFASPAPLTFTPANWNVAQEVTVTAVNDLVAEGTHNITITQSAASSDATYNGIAVASVGVSITDNDTAGVIVTLTSGSTQVIEGGATDTYSVVLNSQPTANVTITLLPGSQVGTSSPTLTFTTGNWNVAQTVIVTAVNDDIAEGNHADTITHTASSTDTFYNNIAVAPVNVGITDNDLAGVTSGASTNVDEGVTSDTYTVALNSQPLANVTITLTFGNQISATPTVLTFTPFNWNVPQSVSVGAIDDNIAEGTHGDTITHTAASADPNYNGIAIGPVNVIITDLDQARVIITSSGGSTQVTEGSEPDTYTVRLTSQPLFNVTVNVTTGRQTTVLPTPLTFTPLNWNVPQTVTVTAIDDAIVENSHFDTISHTVTSADLNYNGVAVSNVPVSITDNDMATTPPIKETPIPSSISAVLVTKKVKKKKFLFIRITDARTGALKQEIRSPFQKPKVKGIVVSVKDTNGDGGTDTVVLTGRKGKKSVTAQFAA